MQPKTLIALFLLVTALLGFIWFFERDQPSSDERRELAQRVLRFEAAAVQSLEIVSRSGRTLLERSEDGEGGAWRVSAPLKARADSARVERLLAGLESLEWSRELSQPDFEAVGLDEPQASLTLHVGSESLRLEVGGEVPASHSRVVAVGGSSDALIVDSESLEDLLIAPGDWRTRRMLEGASEDIAAVTLAGGDEVVRLQRRESSFWIVEPFEDRANEGKVSRLLRALAGLEAREFLDGSEVPPEAMGLEPAEFVAEVTLTGNSDVQRIEIGWESAVGEGVFYAKVGEQVFVTETVLPQIAQAEPHDWRSPKWTSLESFQVDRLTVIDAVGEFSLRRSGAAWSRDGEEIEYEPVGEFLSALVAMRAERLIGKEEAHAAGVRLEHPDLEVILAGSTRAETLRAYPPVQDLVPSRAAERDPVLLIAKASMDHLATLVQTMREAEPLASQEESLEPDSQ